MEHIRPTKAEVLITRECNLSCDYCNMVKSTNEMENWGDVPRRLKNLGVEFAPIYGAEPLMKMDRLCDFITGCTKVGLPCSVITSGYMLNSENVSRLIKAGLTSLTLSVDIKPVSSSAKSKKVHALSKLDMLRPVFQDLEVICTVTDEDWHELPEFITKMSEMGIWTHFDFYHTDKGQEGSKCKGNQMLTPNKESVIRVARALYNMKREGYLVHTSYDVLRRMREIPGEVVNQTWKCIGGSFVTIDVDGSTFFCDDNQPKALRGRFPILEYGETWDWDEFVRASRKHIAKCPGCFWTTHVSSDYWQKKKDKTWIKEMTHGL